MGNRPTRFAAAAAASCSRNRLLNGQECHVHRFRNHERGSRAHDSVHMLRVLPVTIVAYFSSDRRHSTQKFGVPIYQHATGLAGDRLAPAERIRGGQREGCRAKQRSQHDEELCPLHATSSARVWCDMLAISAHTKRTRTQQRARPLAALR
jgi:hypothetical protein